MCDLIVHTSASDAGNQSRCDLDDSVNDALRLIYTSVQVAANESLGKSPATGDLHP